MLGGWGCWWEGETDVHTHARTYVLTLYTQHRERKESVGEGKEQSGQMSEPSFSPHTFIAKGERGVKNTHVFFRGWVFPEQGGLFLGTISRHLRESRYPI